MTTYYARKDYVYEEGDAIFSIPFDYIKKEHLQVYVNDTATENYTFLNSSQIQITDTLAEGDTVSIRRETPIGTRMVTFSDTSILDKDVQNLATQQLFNIVQEVDDNKAYQNAQIDNAVTKATEAVSKVAEIESIKNDITNKYNIVNQQTAVAVAAANQATAGLKWITLNYANWSSSGNYYIYEINNCPSVVGVYRNYNNNKCLVINVNVEITSNNKLILTSLVPFQGWILTGKN